MYTFASISLAFSVGLFTVGKVISHKMAGPIFAFEKYMTDLFEHKENTDEKKEPLKKFKLRAHDEFKELEGIANLITEKINKQ
jgi:signal peptidase II